MKKKLSIRATSLWAHFVITIFDTMIGVSCFLLFVAILADKLGMLKIASPRPITIVIGMIVISMIISTVVSAFIAKVVLKPVMMVSRAMQEVTKGNFDVKLEENAKIEEVNEFQHNFNIMTAELRSIETLRNDFIINVSHEFKTPIAAIDGYATLLQATDISDEEKNEYIRMIIDSARQLSTLTGNILKLSKLENQGVSPEKTTFLLDEQIRQAILMLEAEWSQKNIDLEIELSRCEFYGCSDMLMQVWLNLIGNAIKFSNNSGCVSVSLTEDDDEIAVSVKDYGIGMDEETQKHMFEKFYQRDTTRMGAGNGLGLALVKRIVDICEGRIEVSSELGKGSEFIVLLPKAER